MTGNEVHLGLVLVLVAVLVRRAEEPGLHRTVSHCTTGSSACARAAPSIAPSHSRAGLILVRGKGDGRYSYGVADCGQGSPFVLPSRRAHACSFVLLLRR